MTDPAVAAGAAAQLLAAAGSLAPYAMEVLLAHRVPLDDEASRTYVASR